MPSRVQLRLFVAPDHPPSRRASVELETLCTRRRGWELEIVPLAPEQGGDVHIAPTLVRTSPAPEKRVLGDLTDLQAVLECLDLPGSLA